MHYNQFTIDYIRAIKTHLKIEINEFGAAVFYPNSITPADIFRLTNQLGQLWPRAQASIDIVKSKHDASIQSGLFGVVNEFDTALKVGFLFSDRVVLIDYLYERLLLRTNPDEIDVIKLGSVASALVQALPLAEKGRIVMIPNPFSWHPQSKSIIAEVASKKIPMMVELVSLLNMLSITKICQLHPYTIAESERVYNDILNHHLDQVDAIGGDGGQYAYAGILGGLLTERLLKETRLQTALDIPLSAYVDIIQAESGFHRKYLSGIVEGGSLNAQSNIDAIKDSLEKSIRQRNAVSFPAIAKSYTTAAGIGGGVVTVASAVMKVSDPITLTSALIGLSASLLALIPQKDEQESLTIHVFNKLYHAPVTRSQHPLE
jgi:hypothetical protein